MRKLDTTEIVRELLRTYQEVTCTLNGAEDWTGGKPGSRTLFRPSRELGFKATHPYFEGSYRQLEDILRAMRTVRPVEYWAVAETYIRCEKRVIEVQVTRKAKNHKTVTLTERRVVPVASGAVRPAELEAGVAWIVGEFGRRGLTPFLPTEIYSQVAA